MVSNSSGLQFQTPREIPGFEAFVPLLKGNGSYSIESTEPINEAYLEILSVLKEYDEALDPFAKYCPQEIRHPSAAADDQYIVFEIHDEMKNLWKAVQPFMRSARGWEFSPRRNWGGDLAPDPAKLQEILDLARKRIDTLRGTDGTNNSETITLPQMVEALWAADHSKSVKNRPTMKGYSEPINRNSRTRRSTSFEAGKSSGGLSGTDETKNSKTISLRQIADALNANGLVVDTKNWRTRKRFPKPINPDAKTRYFRLSEVRYWMERHNPQWVKYLPGDDD